MKLVFNIFGIKRNQRGKRQRLTATYKFLGCGMSHKEDLNSFISYYQSKDVSAEKKIIVNVPGGTYRALWYCEFSTMDSK